MPKVSVYNQTGKKTGEIELSDAVFGVKPKESVVHEVYTAMTANARQPWAHTKDKSEIRGGGRKPWKQKGTGRARHGSRRSPIWVGGGITFGPLKFRNFKQKINKKTKLSVTKMCLSDKVAEGKFIVLENLPTERKTKIFALLFEKLPSFGRKTIILNEKKNEIVLRATNNIPKVDVVFAKDVSVVDLLNHQYIVVTKEGIKVLEKRLA